MKNAIKNQALALSNRGMTLLELLVGLALVTVIMTAVMSVALRTNSSSLALQSTSELTSESQIAQNYIASKIRNAVYVFPYVTGSASFFVLSNSGYSTYNPRTTNYNWRLGPGTITADPFIAFIVPPSGGSAVIDGSCATATALPSTNPVETETKETLQARNCYAFYAYYAIPRSQLVTGITGSVPSGPNKLTADPLNDLNGATWVLMEYRGYYAAQASGGYPTNVSGIPQGGTGRLVLDYLSPTTEVGTDKLFIALTNPVSVKVQLATTRLIGNKQVRVPSTGRDSVNVYPRNLSAAPIDN